MDVFNIFKQNIDKITDIREDSLNLIRQKIQINGIYDIDTSRWFDTIQYTSSLNNKIKKYISSCNQFNISRFQFQDNSYKPQSINYEKCVCKTVYGNLFNQNDPFILEKNIYQRSIIGINIKPINVSFLNQNTPKFWFNNLIYKSQQGSDININFKYSTTSNDCRVMILHNNELETFLLSPTLKQFDRTISFEPNININIEFGIQFLNSSTQQIILYRPLVTKIKR